MYISKEAINYIILFGSFIGALAVIWSAVMAVVHFFDKQKQQDKAIDEIKDELTMMTYVMQAVLDGLKQQGCNGEVTVAAEKLSKYINQKAHGGHKNE